MPRARRAPIISDMSPSKPKPLRRYVLVDRRELGAGIRRMKIARVTGVLEVAPSGPAPPPARPAHP